MGIPYFGIRKTSINIYENKFFPFVFLNQSNTNAPTSAIVYNVNGAPLLDARRTDGVDKKSLRSSINSICNRLLSFVLHAWAIV